MDNDTKNFVIGWILGGGTVLITYIITSLLFELRKCLVDKSMSKMNN